MHLDTNWRRNHQKKKKINLVVWEHKSFFLKGESLEIMLVNEMNDCSWVGKLKVLIVSLAAPWGQRSGS